MSSLTHEVTSEVAYDLMHDHLDTILALLEGPLPRDEVARRVGSDKVLDRMVRYGLITANNNQLHAVSTVYHKLRQESMMSFLEHYILPSMTAGVDGGEFSNGAGFSNVGTRYLKLSPTGARALRGGRVQDLFNRLIAVSDQPSDGVLYRLTVMVVGTTHVESEELEDGEQALRHLKGASIQRATESERDLAVLSQYVFLADNRRFAAALEAVDDFLKSFESERASSPEEASYHLTVASHWRCTTPAASNESTQ